MVARQGLVSDQRMVDVEENVHSYFRSRSTKVKISYWGMGMSLFAINDSAVKLCQRDQRG